MCDVEGGINRVRVKKWMLVYRVEVKQLSKEKLFFQLLRVLDRRLQTKHLNKHEYA